MTARVTSALLVSALIRRVQAAGGAAAVLAKGDADAGAILLAIAERGRTTSLLERVLGPDDRYRWAETGPSDLEAPGALSDHLAKRRRRDPDLWVVELDGGQAREIADEMLSA